MININDNGNHAAFLFTTSPQEGTCKYHLYVKYKKVLKNINKKPPKTNKENKIKKKPTPNKHKNQRSTFMYVQRRSSFCIEKYTSIVVPS